MHLHLHLHLAEPVPVSGHDGPLTSIVDAVALLRSTGASTSLWETTKFTLRRCRSLSAHQHWLRFLTANKTNRRWLHANPSLMWKLQRPYLQSNWSTFDKLLALEDHYRWVAEQWPPTLVRRLQTHRLEPLTGFDLVDDDERPVHYGIDLDIDARFAKEGELVLSLWRGRVRLASLAFTVRSIEHCWVAHIGCLQGPAAGPDNLSQIRMATKELQGLRPKQALMQVLYTVAGCLKITRIMAVANQAHVYQANTRRRERVQSDYDGFWREMGASAQGMSFMLPDRLQQKALADIPSRKRALYRRRQAIEAEMAAQVTRALRSSPSIPPASCQRTVPGAEAAEA